MRSKTSYTRPFRIDYAFTTEGCYPVQLTVYKALRGRPAEAKAFDRVPRLVATPEGLQSKPMLTRKEAATYLRTARRQGVPIHRLG